MRSVNHLLRGDVEATAWWAALHERFEAVTAYNAWQPTSHPVTPIFVSLKAVTGTRIRARGHYAESDDEREL